MSGAKLRSLGMSSVRPVTGRSMILYPLGLSENRGPPVATRRPLKNLSFERLVTSLVIGLCRA
jgi:hypothetical protein